MSPWGLVPYIWKGAGGECAIVGSPKRATCVFTLVPAIINYFVWYSNSVHEDVSVVSWRNPLSFFFLSIPSSIQKRLVCYRNKDSDRQPDCY